MAALVLLFFLHLNPHNGMPLREHVRQFDFLGLVLLVGGVVCLLIGFNSGETNCEFHLFSQGMRGTLTRGAKWGRGECGDDRVAGGWGCAINRCMRE